MKNFYYFEEYKNEEEEKPTTKYDLAILQLEQNLEKEYGYLGIDVRKNNMEGVKEVEICGYPGDKEIHTMWNAFGPYKSVTDSLLTYRIPTKKGQSGSPILKR